ncbi:hypothetical protein M9H77_04309 [Catharanthus roseus]|uniref:Uncharacterized protein n=1 Tax=Catharanthus roseus TaxID=4058 RepID=A0ACC0CE82_CATRO|nr:hypothetical protein M9H77_04309 [Catharanthus roseus]
MHPLAVVKIVNLFNDLGSHPDIFVSAAVYFEAFNLVLQKKLKDDDVAICECKYVFGDPESACGERCLNVLTSTECTPGYCRCGDYCKNQIVKNLFLISSMTCVERNLVGRNSEFIHLEISRAFESIS